MKGLLEAVFNPKVDVVSVGGKGAEENSDCCGCICFCEVVLGGGGFLSGGMILALLVECGSMRSYWAPNN